VRSIGDPGTALVFTTGSFSYIPDDERALFGEVQAQFNGGGFNTEFSNTFDITAVWDSTGAVINSESMNFYKVY
jgi:hypothetical protein